MTRRRSGTSGTGCIPTALSCVLLELGSTELGKSRCCSLLHPRPWHVRDGAGRMGWAEPPALSPHPGELQP